MDARFRCHSSEDALLALLLQSLPIELQLEIMWYHWDHWIPYYREQHKRQFLQPLMHAIKYLEPGPIENSVGCRVPCWPHRCPKTPEELTTKWIRFILLYPRNIHCPDCDKWIPL